MLSLEDFRTITKLGLSAYLFAFELTQSLSVFYHPHAPTILNNVSGKRPQSGGLDLSHQPPPTPHAHLGIPPLSFPAFLKFCHFIYEPLALPGFLVPQVVGEEEG